MARLAVRLLLVALLWVITVVSIVAAYIAAVSHGGKIKSECPENTTIPQNLRETCRSVSQLYDQVIKTTFIGLFLAATISAIVLAGETLAASRE